MAAIRLVIQLELTQPMNAYGFVWSDCTYRVTYRTRSGHAQLAVGQLIDFHELVALGYDVYKVTHCFPTAEQ